MSLIRTRATALALAATALLSTAAVAPAASAADSQCSYGYSCVWTDSNYTGSFSWRGNANYTEWHAVGGYIFNDSISSIWNRNQSRKLFYEHADRGGIALEVRVNEKIANLQDRHTGLWQHPDWNDFISSVN